ncbi:olfactory receptor 6F1-like [Gastrophryne carolinensis]
MTYLNKTIFVLIGFKYGFSVQIVEFFVFASLYLISLTGNLSIIVAIRFDRRLHVPMYLFLVSLAFLDICFISSTVPTLLTILAFNNREISFLGCFVQMYFYLSLGAIEFYILALMSVDRYLAICHPLRYNSIISNIFCLWLVLMSWIFGYITCVYPLILVCKMSFCGPYEINHFFCDSSAVVVVSCSGIKQFHMIFGSIASAVILSSFIITLISYLKIFLTVIMIPSTSGKTKAFSTCTSHFIVVSLAYGSAIFIYVRPANSSSTDLKKVVALLNSIITPVLHPFIYSLRNNQVQQALKFTFNEVKLVFCDIPN